jgi:hypothetical protein
VLARSPARKEGVRTGDYIKAINGKTYTDFHADPPPPGKQFTIEAFRHGSGEYRTFGVLGREPKPNKQPAWLSAPAVLPGRVVARNERPAFLGFIAKHRRIPYRYKTIIGVLIEHDGKGGIFPKHGTIAAEMGCSIATVKRAICCCQHFGVLHVMSGKPQRASNRYFLCWPAHCVS